MGTLLGWFGNHDGYMPHGHCYLWQPAVLWLHVVANALIAAAYIAIPVVLYWYVRRRRHELPYWWVPVLFAAFILLCGFTHVSNIWVIWNPDYRVDGVLKLATGIVSVATAVALGAIMPRVMQLRTPTQLVAEVDSRTAALRASNERLRDALAETERYAAALRRSEARYRHATDALRGYVYEIDPSTGRVTATRGVKAVLGIELASTPLSVEWWEAQLHPDDRARVAATWRRARDEGLHSSSCRYRLRTAAGSYRWVWDHALFIRDAGGAVECIVGNVLDVTDEEAARVAAAESERRFRQIADLMPDVVFVTDADGRAEYVNPRWTEKTGAADATPDSLRAAILDDDRAPLATAWDAARGAGAPLAHEFRMRHRETGVVHWFVVRARAVRDESGRIVRWVGSATDIDAQKRAQEVLADADARKDAFLATLAHELRNPLAPIRYSIRLLEPGVPEETAATARAMIRRQLAHMARLLDDLLDVGRITRGTLELRPEPLDLRVVVREAADTARPLFEAARHVLHLHLPGEPVNVDGDGMRLQQVIGNLLNNAARYTDPGGRIDVELRRDEQATSIVVRDTGSGIEPDALERIFELFAQADRTARASAGLGIGLALARQIVQLHGGTLRAASAGPGRGSTFTVTLPRSR